jgi:hypothetical protein
MTARGFFPQPVKSGFHPLKQEAPTKYRGSAATRCRLEGEAAADYRSQVVGVVIGDAGAVWNGDG